MRQRGPRPRRPVRSGPAAEPVLLADILTSDTQTEPQSRGTRDHPWWETDDSAIRNQHSALFLVSAIERQEKRRRYNVFVDGEFALALDPEVLAGSGLKVGEPVSPERLRELSVEELRRRALDGALRLLAARPRSEAEVRERLVRRGLPHDIIVHTFERLREYGYVNDVEFARFWVESRSGANPRGRFVVQRELRGKGVDHDTAETAMEALTEESSAVKAARKKLRSVQALEYQEFRTRLTGYLVRRGFGYEVVRQTVNDLWKETKGQLPDEDGWDGA